MDHQDLTPQKIRFLKFMYEQGGTARSGEIASRFRIRTPTVTRTLHELEAAGFLIHSPYQEAVLTDYGSDTARYLIRRHRIIVLMLCRSGLCEQDACSQAERIEHLVPRDHVNRICRYFGHPMKSSCGMIDHEPGCCIEVIE
jgi:DtxR family Mn-dependent transcriptional regulator